MRSFIIVCCLMFGMTEAFKPKRTSTLKSTTNLAATSFVNQESYLEYLSTISELPQGFSVGNSRFNFRPFEVDKTLPMNVTIIKTDKPSTSFAAMFTRNEFPGGPIIVGKERLKSSKYLQGVVVNNKISNVCPGGSPDRGAGDSDAICEAAAKILGLESKNAVLPSSTGIIGWRLPVSAITGEGIPLAAKNMQSKSILPAAIGITTTDRYPKVRSYRSKKSFFGLMGKEWSIVATAKGAGMIGTFIHNTTLFHQHFPSLIHHLLCYCQLSYPS